MKNTQILIALITISSLTILNSCSSGTENAPKETTTEETPIEAPIAEDVSRNPVQTRVDSTYIKNWENIRTDINSLKNVFANGNKFSFTLSDATSSDSILAVPFLITKTNKFGFYILKAENNSFIQCSYVMKSKGNILPNATRTQNKKNTKNIDDISYQPATIRVKRFSANACSKKEDWITSNVKSKTIYKYFIINAMDIEYGTQHDCYFSLRRNTIKKITSNGFVADLVIVNTKTGKLVEARRKRLETLEDLVAPVPPFDPGRTK